MRIETFVHFISASSVYEPIDRCVSLIAGLTNNDLITMYIRSLPVLYIIVRPISILFVEY